jgi:radical SAM-linked protein
MRGHAGFPVRVRYAKRGKIRFISHRDVARAFERAFRVLQLPLAFTEGFSPRPRVSFGPALSVGHESEAEYLDVELSEPVDVDALVTPLTDVLPEGMPITGTVRLAERAPALQESITEVQFRIEPVYPDGTPITEELLVDAVSRALASGELAVTRTRKGRESVDDIRPAIRALDLVCGAGVPALEVDLSTQPRGVRPREVVDALGALVSTSLEEGRVTRIAQWIERGGARLEPLEADALARALMASAS